MSNPKFRVRRIHKPDWHRSAAGVYEVEANPRGASIPAFRLRTRYPVDVMSASRQPGSLLAQTNHIDPRLASRIVEEADRAAGKRGILWAKFAKTEEPGPWCGLEKNPSEPDWPVSSAEERLVLMQCQWMAEWFSRELGEATLHEACSLLGRGTPGPALERILSAVREAGTPVPRRYANTFERLALACGLPDDAATSIWSFVPPTDGVNFWSELLPYQGLGCVGYQKWTMSWWKSNLRRLDPRNQSGSRRKSFRRGGRLGTTKLERSSMTCLIETSQRTLRISLKTISTLQGTAGCRYTDKTNWIDKNCGWDFRS